LRQIFRGQLGCSDVNRTNVFKLIAAFPDPVVRIGVGDESAHFLLESGRVFATGNGEKHRLLIGAESDVRVPREVDMCVGYRFSWLAVGCSSVVLQAGAHEMLRHPLVIPPDEVVCAPYRINVGRHTVNIAFGVRAALSCQPSDTIALDKQQLRFVGTVATTRVLVLTTTDQPMTVSVAQFCASRTGTAVQSRSGTKHCMRAGADLMPFCFREAETVRHRDFGDGTVTGVSRGRVEFRWTSDKGITTGTNLEPAALHARIEITRPSGRRVIRAQVEGALANLEVHPCNALAVFQLAVNDVVRRAIHLILGEFTFRAVVPDLGSGKAALAPLGELALVGRPGAPAKRYVRDFAWDVVELDLEFQDGAPVVPGDRLLTAKGFATVVAAGPGGLWIQADAATRLNAGVLRYGGAYRVVRRALATKEVAGSLPGDVVSARGKKWVVVDTGKGVALEESGGGEVIPEAQIAAEAPVVLFRLDLPHLVELAVGRGLKGKFSVSSVDFKGKRVFPGDVIEVNNRRVAIAGYRDDAV
jgi:hypothetical protein